MKDIYALLSLSILTILLIFVSFSRVLAIGGINPDLPVLLFAWLSSLRSSRRPDFLSFLFLSIIFIVFAFLITNFWLAEEIVLFAIFMIFFYVGKILTGNWLLDFVVLQIAGVAVFYLATSLILRTPFEFSYVLGEMAYNLAISLVLWPALRKIN